MSTLVIGFLKPKFPYSFEKPMVLKQLEKLFWKALITARKRSLRRLCFHRCLSVHGGEGWSLSSGVSVSGGLCPMVSVKWGLYHGDPPPYGNEWEVRILLECILVHVLLFYPLKID